jgi:hypothetical protein
MYDVPITLVVFNRPEHARRVLERIRAVRPRQLFVVADGPRKGQVADVENCTAVRQLIADEVDWPCDVRRDFAEENMGCARRVSSGLNWVFTQVEETIVLEDDCIPEVLFFPFCAELLERYRHTPEIGLIAGDNFQSTDVTAGTGYYFSHYAHCWGWATWRRAWATYDHGMTDWPEVKHSGWLRERFGRSREARFWEQIFDRVARGQIDSWDYRWVYACWRHNFLTILPAANLVTNIGFDTAGTHTQKTPMGAVTGARGQPWPLQSPRHITRNVIADRYTYTHHLDPSLWVRAQRLLGC